MGIKISDMTDAPLPLGGDEQLEVSIPGSTAVTRRTTTAAVAALAASVVSSSALPYADPSHRWFGPSGVTVSSTASQINGDAFIVWDGSQFVLFYFETVTGSPYVRTRYRTAASLEGPWSSATTISSLDGYHKFVLLVDEFGDPVIVGGTYHGYGVTLTGGAISGKEIWHMTASTLTGTWTVGSKVIAKGGSGTTDEYNTDTPYALWDGTTARIWYMAATTSSQADFGYAERMRLATATNPDGPFTKDSTDVLVPNVGARWDHGWIGGAQVRKSPSGYVMIFNAGDTRPSSAGTEPNTSAIGLAYSDSLDGPWTKDPNNPYLSVSNTPTDSLEQTNIWRGHYAYDPVTRMGYVFYNTGGAGVEIITFARAGVKRYGPYGTGGGLDVQAVTTSVVAITNSRVNLQPGVYRVNAKINYIGDTGGTQPHLDIDTALRVNGTAVQTVRDFIGNYNYENRDTDINDIVGLGAAGYVDLTTQCTGGTPTGGTMARRLRINIEQLSRPVE